MVDIGTTLIAEQIVGKEPRQVAAYFGQEHRMGELEETLKQLKLPWMFTHAQNKISIFIRMVFWETNDCIENS